MNKQYTLKQFVKRQTDLFASQELCDYLMRTDLCHYDESQAKELALQYNLHNNSDIANSLICQYDNKAVSEIDQALLRSVKKMYSGEEAELAKQYKEASIKANYEYEHGNDEQQYLRCLNDVFDICKKISATHDVDHPMDYFLSKHKYGLTVKMLDDIIPDIKETCLQLIHNQSNTITNVEVDSKYNAVFGQQIIDAMGMPYTACDIPNARLSFCNLCGNRDVRLAVTNNEFWQYHYGLLHELGHARYIYDTDAYLEDYGLWLPTDCALDEAIALFFENCVGNSLPYLNYISVQLQKVGYHYSPQQIKAHHDAINATLSRAQSDIVTYLLHIILRYEVEKMLLDGSLSVFDMPALWQKKTQQYFGMSSNNYRDNYAQDVHWTAGYIGYFPMYLLGRIYSCAIWEAMPDFSQSLAEGKLDNVCKYVHDNITRYGSLYTADQLLVALTGKTMDIDPLIRYLKGKI